MIKQYSRLTTTVLLLINSCLLSQDYKIQFSHIPIGQGVTLNDSVGIMNSIGGVVSKDVSSDSFLVGAGFLKTTQNVLAEPPVISAFDLPSLIEKNGEASTVTASMYDLNGIGNAYLYIQLGGTLDGMILPMSSTGNNGYEVEVHDSLIALNNFRARVVGIDNMGYETITEYKSTDIKFNNTELTMASEFSHYPNGIDKGAWKLISWPSQPGNTSLAVSTLEQGHVFHSWNPVKEVYSYPTEIEIGHSYWFKHRYKDAVIFEEDTATAIPLDSFVIDLRSGWNLIGSPFSFPVKFEKDSIVSDPITYGLPDKSSGWSGPQNELMPWNGYAVYSAQAAAITILPFSDPDSSAARIASTNEWYLNIKLESDTYFNYSSEIGRRKYANNSYDHFDTPLFPEIDKGISLAMDLNGSGLFNYQRDIRDIEEMNGIWNLRLDNNEGNKEIFLSGDLRGSIPDEFHIAMVDIAERNVINTFLEEGMIINQYSDLSYDIKLVAGDLDYVNRTTEEILSNIPSEFSLGQNYPNPFNPITKMDYTLPKRSRVIISIYNVLGQEIVNLVNEEQGFGYHSITWNGTDQLGRQMASGVYFTRMVSETFSQTKKMLLLK